MKNFKYENCLVTFKHKITGEIVEVECATEIQAFYKYSTHIREPLTLSVWHYEVINGQATNYTISTKEYYYHPAFGYII